VGRIPGTNDRGEIAKYECMRRPKAGRLVQNAIALIISGAGSGAIGIVFWAVAAHSASEATIDGHPPKFLDDVVGNSRATQFWLIVRALLARCGNSNPYIRKARLRDMYQCRPRPRRGLRCVWLLAQFSAKTLGWRALFVGSVVIWTVFSLQDSVLIGLRSSKLVPVENISYSIVKLALIPAFIVVSKTEGILLAWIVPVIALIIAVNWYLFRKRIPEHAANSTASEALPSARELFSLTGAQYATLLITVGTSSVITLVVIDRLGAVASAHYYLPAQIAGGVATAIWSIDRSFLVEASADRHYLRRHAKSALRVGLVVLGASILFGEIFAPEILRIFGASYASTGRPCCA